MISKTTLILRKLRIIISAVLVILVLFSIGFNIVIYQNSIETSEATILNHSISVSREVATFFAYYMGETAILEQNEMLIEYIRDMETREDKKNHPLYLEVIAYLQKIKASDKNHAYAWVSLFKINDFLVDRPGSELPEDYDITTRPWYPELIASKSHFTVTSPYNDVFFDDTIVSIITPVWDQEELIGSIGVDIMIESIISFIGNYHFGDTGEALLVAPNGKILSPNPEYDGLNINDVDNELSQISSGHNNHFSKLHRLKLFNKEVVISHQPVGDLSWSVAVIIEDQELMAHSMSMIRLSILLIFFTLVIVLLFSLLLRMTSDNDILKATNEALKEKERIIVQKNQEKQMAYDQLSAAEEELKAQYDELHQSYQNTMELQHRLEMAVEYTHAIVWEYYPDVKELEIVAGFGNLDYFPYDTTKSFDENIHDLVMHDDLEDLSNTFDILVQGEMDHVEFPFRNRNHNNEWVWSLFMGNRVYDQEANFSKILGYVININDIKQKDERLKEQAFIDPLTELPNRRKFIEELTNELTHERSGAVVMLDLDNFKQINDIKGHVYGDEILKILSKRLNDNLNDEFLSRFGGDEFLILIKDETNKHKINQKIKNIINTIKECININDEKNYISASIGISLYPETASDVSTLIMQADLAMYEVKNSGKNRYLYYYEAMNTETKKRIAIEEILQEALAHDGFELLYQPQYAVDAKSIIGVEALIRLKSRAFGPHEFIPVAEETGMIIEIGRWVVKEAIEQLCIWKEHGLPDIKMGINFSTIQLHDDGFIDYLASQLTNVSVSPSCINIEVTESILLRDKSESISFLTKLREMGVTISLDDFGTGYSSLSYLLSLPVDTIKLDKAMIDDFNNEKTRKVIENMIHLAHDIDLDVVAEGVENEMQLALLSHCECDYIQGYLLSKPIPAHEFENISNNKKS